MMTVNGNVSTAYVNLAPISQLEMDQMEAGLNPNQINFTLAPGSVDDVKPDSTWSKAGIRYWLDDHGIAYPTPATKAELLALVP